MREGERTAELGAALADLRAAGFEFGADVRVAAHPLSVCSGIRCADVRIVANRRTIAVAPEAFASPGKLRMTLLEIHARYETPRDDRRRLALGALQALRAGPRVGVTDRALLRAAHRSYRKLVAGLPREARQDLPAPDSIPYP